MRRPETPEELARRLRDETSALRADPLLAARVVVAAGSRGAIERPAFVVVAMAASLSLWLTLQGGAQPSAEVLEDDLEGEEGLL